MIYSKHKTTSEAVFSAAWEKQDKIANKALQKLVPGAKIKQERRALLSCDCPSVTNNALRRMGLKPRRRNGMRKKKWTQQRNIRIIMEMNANAIQPLLPVFIQKMVEHLCEMFTCRVTIGTHVPQDEIFELSEKKDVEV